jgi:aminopeptidase
MFFAARKPFHDRQIRYLSPWLVGAVPTEAWARKLGITVDALWGLIFKVTGIDRDDPIGYLEGTVAALKRRTERLNKLGIRTLHFQGLGTELRVGLSERARWLGGAKQAEDGVWFVSNWPTFEVFTTPDWRSVTGHVAITKPCVVSGNVVQGLRLKIEGGEIVALAAEAGQNAYERLVATEDSLDTTAPKFRGARRVGEVALVGGSPVAQAGTLFYSCIS